MTRGRDWSAATPARVAAGIVAAGAALAVFGLATELFPLHSANHDEGVYLQQAAMLLDGQLWLTPGSAALKEAFHPWFFVDGDRGLYPRYSPVPAGVFAIGIIAGDPRLSLAGVAGLVVGLGYVLAAAAFDRPTGVLAAGILAAAPLFLLSTSVFLPYAPTAALGLVFAVAYVRAVRHADRRAAVVAGGAIGLAFFARPYTAVLVSVPFIGHAGTRLAAARRGGRGPLGPFVVTAAVGLGFVGVTLAYNAVVTGAPLRFPYEAFAPRDGLGFGRRRLLGHAVDYSPAVALRANARVVWALATRWFTAGPLGTLAAVTGVAAVAVDIRRRGIPLDEPLSDRQLRVVLGGVVASVIAGNVYFWGNLNILGDPAVPGDAFIDLFGPFYHYDVLVPLSAFAAHGVLAGGELIRTRLAGVSSPATRRVAIAVLVLTALPAAVTAEAAVLGPPVDRNAAYTAKVEHANAPLAAADLGNALVFLPPTYGEWRNHPFQWLRNDPGFDGETVYALSLAPAGDFAVMDAYPDRRYYRYSYHGEWTPRRGDRVEPVLDRVRIVEGEAVTARTVVAVPDRIVRVAVAVDTGDTIARYAYEGAPPREIAVTWTIAEDGIRVDGANLSPLGEPAARLPVSPAEVGVTVTLTEPGGGTLTYREDVQVRRTGGGVQAVWPPRSTVCLLVTACGRSGTYVPDRPETRPDGIAMRTELRGGSA